MKSNPDKKWECPQCFKNFKYRYHLRRHSVTHEVADPVKCEICGKTLKHLIALRPHFLNSHRNKPKLPCPICHQSFASATTLRRHTRTVHSTTERERFPCSFPSCEIKFSRKGGAEEHFRVFHSENPTRYSCTLCRKGFKSRHDLSCHIATHTTEKTHKCSTCGKSFIVRKALRRHEFTHIEKSHRQVWRCHICPKTFLTSHGLKRHLQGSHENQDKISYPCTFCEKRFKWWAGLNNHLVVAHPARDAPLQHCHKCEYKTYSKYYLARHMKRHGVKGHQCYFCRKRFHTFPELVGHCGRIHNLER
ncbi:PR domain zinc finger protein 5-like [Folsomia candida]|nr:PR domain zinc finger protein 5-like [Folsomia candida]